MIMRAGAAAVLVSGAIEMVAGTARRRPMCSIQVAIMTANNDMLLWRLKRFVLSLQIRSAASPLPRFGQKTAFAVVD